MINADRHQWTRERLSDYLDGALPQATSEEVGAHLAACDGCRAVHDDLRAVAQAARAMGPLEPPRDLWPGIAQGLRPREESRGGWAPSTPSSRAPRPLLAAAAVVLVAVSASLAWWGRGALVVPPAATPPAPAVGVVRPAASANVELPESMAAELQRLEAVVSGVRERLDPGTVEVLERNLLLIERAIEDSYRALAVDPENDFVRQHLERTYQRKIDFLRELSQLTEAAG